jgi:hypothetical protein
MESYRFFGVDAQGEIVSDQFFECADDEEARGLAVVLQEQGAGIEVWDVNRCVAKLARVAPNASLLPPPLP